MVAMLFDMGFKTQTTASQKWKQALFFINGEKTLFVLVRTRGVDVLETPLKREEMTNPDGLLSVTMRRTGDRFAEFFYTDSHLPVNERVLEIASHFVNNLNIDQSHFQKIGIGRREWGEKYGEKSKRSNRENSGSLCSLYADLAIEEGEDVYLSDGVWLSSDGSLHDRGR
ncbi:hypothetical protein [Cognatazoarcus halotolerans]|uniref:hypothetical protein n=1 Tax=Cognatazoarcus halotolerans TaxID=2686016 RepID=UPI00135BE5B8|nr:hypothetical protein [Cognatazoarcus halotolerans]